MGNLFDMRCMNPILDNLKNKGTLFFSVKEMSIMYLYFDLTHNSVAPEALAKTAAAKDKS